MKLRGHIPVTTLPDDWSDVLEVVAVAERGMTDALQRRGRRRFGPTTWWWEGSNLHAEVDTMLDQDLLVRTIVNTVNQTVNPEGKPPK